MGEETTVMLITLYCIAGDDKQHFHTLLASDDKCFIPFLLHS